MLSSHKEFVLIFPNELLYYMCAFLCSNPRGAHLVQHKGQHSRSLEISGQCQAVCGMEIISQQSRVRVFGGLLGELNSRIWESSWTVSAI